MSGNFDSNWIGVILVLFVLGLGFVIGAVAVTRRKVREAEKEEAEARGSEKPE